MAIKLYVGGLPFATTDEELRTFFEQAGTVATATVITDKFTGRSKGFGFVEMASDDDAKKAISELSGKTLGDRTVRVEESKPSTGGRGGGGGGYGDRGRGGGRDRW